MKHTTPKRIRFQPWVKLWREERGAFALLPLLTRAFAGELLKIVDANGELKTGAESLAPALGRLLHAHVGERRMIPRMLQELAGAEYIEIGDSWMRVCAWHKWQEIDPTEPPRTVGEPLTNHERTVHEPTTNQQRTVHEKTTKCLESLDSPLTDKRREDKIRQDDIRKGDKPPPIEVLEVFDFWKAKTGKLTSRLLPVRVKLIERALRDWSIDDLKKVIEHTSSDPWHISVGKTELEYVFRNYSLIESALHRKAAPSKGPLPVGDFSHIPLGTSRIVKL